MVVLTHHPADGLVYNRNNMNADARQPTWLVTFSTILGLVLVPTGLMIAHRPGLLGINPRSLLNPPIVHNGAEIFTGLALMALGSLVLALVCRSPVPRMSTTLPSPRPRMDVAAAALILAGLALTAALWWNLDAGRYPWWNALLFLLALALVGVGLNRLDRPISWRSPFDWVDAGIAVACAAVSAAINTIGLVRWQFAWIGDEVAFFRTAQDILEGWNHNPFHLTGVYEAHPVADTVYQAVAMRLFGSDAWGWRFGEVLVLAAVAALIYLLGTLLFDRLAGVTAAVVVGVSHYLMAFTRIAYNNLHALFWSTLAVVMIALAWRTRRVIFTWGAGCAVGLCVYTFTPALFVGPTLAVLLGIPFLRRPSRRQAAAGALLIVAFTVVVIPGLISTPPSEVVEVVQRESKREFSSADPTSTFVYSLTRSFVSLFVNFEWHHHYVAEAVLDPISAVLFAIGLTGAVLGIRRRGERTVLLWFGIGLLLLALTTYLQEPHLTRLLYLLPPAALIAGLGARTVWRAITHVLRWPWWIGCVALVSITAGIPPVNAYILHIHGPRHLRIEPEALAVKALMDHPDDTIVFVYHERNENLELLLRCYPELAERAVVMAQDELEFPPPPSGHLLRIPLVWTCQEDLFESLRESLAGSHRIEEIRGPSGETTAWIFHPEDGGPLMSRPGCFTDMGLELELEVGRRGRDRPRDLAADSAFRIYVAVQGENRIHVYSPDGRLLDRWGPTGGPDSAFAEPSAVVIDSKDSLWILDTLAGQVFHADTDGEPLEGSLPSVGYVPRGLGLAPNDDLLVALTGHGEVQRYDRSGKVVFSLPGSSGVELSEPADVVMTPDGGWFVLAARDHTVWRFDPDGRPVTHWKTRSNVAAADSGRLAYHPSGHLLVTEPTNDLTGHVTIFDLDGGICGRWSFPGIAQPVGIDVDRHGRVLIAFPESCLIRVYRPGAVRQH